MGMHFAASPYKMRMVNMNKNSSTLFKKIKAGRYLLIMILPAVIYIIMFKYVPMWGVLIAFKRYSPFLGFFKSSWVGLKNFEAFFSSPNAIRLIRNTFLLSFYSLLWGFPSPIILALIMNEIRNMKIKKFIQTVTYMPHFISTVVLVSMVTMLLSPTTGIINNLIASLGADKINFMSEAKWFRTIYIASGIWQATGWGSIIYMAAISNISPSLYESAVIDGAGKLRQITDITLPGIMPTIITLLLLNVGNILSVGFEKAFLMQQPVIYETADVIQTYVYRQGMISANFGYATAIGLFDALVGIVFVIGANALAKRFGETSLW